MKNKKTWGGPRIGAGRKETGRNTKNVTFSIPNQHVDLIKALVKSKLTDLKNGNKEIKMTPKKGPSVEAANILNHKYLQTRRNAKLGLR